MVVRIGKEEGINVIFIGRVELAKFSSVLAELCLY